MGAFAVSAYKWPNDGMHRYSTDFTLSENNFVDTIPIIFSGNQIYIPVYIDGKRHLFNFDTGSSQGIAYVGSGISYSAPLGNINSRDANGLVDTIKVVKFPDLQLGSNNGLKISGYVGSLIKRPGKHYFYDGVIGFDIVNKGLQLKIDARAGHMILTDRKDFFKQESGLKMKYKLTRWTPYLTSVPFLSVKEPTLFDTGMGEFYVISRSTFDKYRKQDPRVPMMVEETTYGSMTQGSFGAEKNGLMFYIKFPALKIGEASFNDVHGYTTQGGTKLGATLLNYGSLVIDGKHKTMKFQPYNGGASIEVDNIPRPISFTELDGKVVATTIRHRSDLYINGLREGDIILKVNGKEVSSETDVKTTKGTKIIAHDSRGFDKEIDL